ncbi:hypothetical protein CAP39_06810 [Sphingomonas sp. IBVSS1]|nr:hypothetical protein CAP39_06810 [Sphingomonas sp. IBVSS1]
MLINRRALLASLAGSPLLAATEAEPATIFRARRIITMDPALPLATHVAVADGRILAVSRDEAGLAPALAGRAARLDQRFANAVLMPGLIDPHVHPMQSAVMLNLPFVAPEDWVLPSGRFAGAQSPAAYRDRLGAELARSDADPFICWGHHELFHGPIDRAWLDALAPDRPVLIWQRSFHEVIANTRMLQHWGLADRAAMAAAVAAAGADPAHADLARGIFSETALPIALARLRPVILTPQRIASGMAAMLALMRGSGVTTVSDMATGIFAGFDTEAAMIRAAFERPDVPARVMLMPIAGAVPSDIDLDRWFADLATRWASPHVRVDRRVKLLADGAFFAQNMMMRPPGYSDGHVGKWITPPATLAAQMQRFHAAGFSLHIHVNGNEGLAVVLDGLRQLGPSRTGQTVTLEHLGYADPDQIAEIARLGLMVSAQPNYIRVLGDVYGRHGLGPERADHMNRLGSLQRAGVTLGLHSDFNMAPIDPLYLAWIAANRITIAGNRKAADERLSIQAALRAITIDAARVIGMDAVVGSVTPGKRADFTALAHDPADLGRERLREVGVVGLIHEGRPA